MEANGDAMDPSSLLQALKSSNDLEHQTLLINQLVESCELASHGTPIIVEFVHTLWADAFGMRECVLNQAVLNLTIKCFKFKASSCLSHFVILCTKASSWVLKHFEASLFTEESEKDMFFQLVMDVIRFSSVISTALATTSLKEKALQLIVESFVLEQMNLMKALITEMQKIHYIMSPMLKVVQPNLDALIRLSRSNLEAIKCESNVLSNGHTDSQTDRPRLENNRHVINVTACIVQNLHDLGVIAASGGGNLVALLNTSWKGVVTLLQLGKGILCKKINEEDFIRTLISLAVDALRVSTITWTHSLTENLSSSEAKRVFLPVKFFLINAVRIYSEYPCQTFEVYDMAAKCALMVSCLGISFSKEENLRAASEVLTEVLEPTSFLLFCTVLNSPDVNHDDKLRLLDKVFSEDNESCNGTFDIEIGQSIQETTSAGQKINLHDKMDAEALMLGKMLLFLNILKSSMHLKEEILFALSRKLDLVLTWLMNEDVFASSLSFHFPLSSLCDKTTNIVWQPLVPYILHCIKTFMVVSASSERAWDEIEYFLLENLFHPHMFCTEIVIELLCFLVRNAKLDTVQDILDGLHSLLKSIAASEPILTPFSDLRRMAKSVAIIISCAPKLCVDCLYSTIIDDKSNLSFIKHIALLMEGYPLDLLSEKVRSRSFQQIQKSFVELVGTNPKELLFQSSSRYSFSSVLGLPAHALLCVLQKCQIDGTDLLDKKTTSQFLKFAISFIRECSNALNSLHESHYALLGILLDIISNLKTLFTSEEIGNIVLELHTLFRNEPVPQPNAVLHQHRASLLAFMACLSHIDIEETDANIVCRATWALYHILLKERHWAFIHLALTSFGYFTARTSCNELWRFVPEDAALSFDIETGEVPCEERFMLQFKSFLEKEVSSDIVASSKVQFNFLKKEGVILKNKVREFLSNMADIPDLKDIKGDGNKQSTSKKRKMPGGVIEGLAMLQSGLKVLNDAFSHEDSSELKEEFSIHLSGLEDVLSHLFHLSDKN